MARPKKEVVEGAVQSFSFGVDRYHVKLAFMAAVLGSQPGRDDPASKFIRDRAREENPSLEIPAEEVQSLPQEVAKGTTCFYRDNNGNVCFKNYQVLGMLRAAATSLNGLGGVNGLRSRVAAQVKVTPVTITTGVPECQLTILERPLRGMTAQGPRTSLARSELLAEGAKLEFFVELIQLPKFHFPEELLKALLDYSSMQLGLGQWVNSQIYGRFTYTMTKV